MCPKYLFRHPQGGQLVEYHMRHDDHLECMILITIILACEFFFRQ